MSRGSARVGLCLALAALCAPGCSYHLHSPPASTFPLTPNGALDFRETHVSVQGGATLGWAVLDYAPSLASAALDLAVGLGDDFDIDMSSRVMGLLLFDGEYSPHDTRIGAGRLGLRWAPEPWLAADLGFGGGLHAAGTFVSPDLGITMGTTNEHASFFFDIRGGLSMPVDARELELTQPDDRERHFSTPILTGLVQASPGVDIELFVFDESGIGINLQLAANFAFLFDSVQFRGFIGGGGAIELVFGAPAEESVRVEEQDGEDEFRVREWSVE